LALTKTILKEVVSFLFPQQELGICSPEQKGW